MACTMGRLCSAIALMAICTGLLAVPASKAQVNVRDGSRDLQIVIPRVEQMPNLPEPFEIRDWKDVAIGYDSLVFDLEREGQFLPLIWEHTSTVNYPNEDSFGLETVVGTPRTRYAEALNVLPALIGATLVGIDKSDQNGRNWVLMAQEFFNRGRGENIYLNRFVGKSGIDSWYDLMPNVLFYQLYDLYPGTGDFEYQFTSVADQFLRALREMGGSTQPWRYPYMHYRAWSFSEMEPLEEGVRQPDAAGSFAWILYNAYVETGEEKYRIGAEWAMEFLNSQIVNPFYELQLAYGTYMAARMNAELGTVYDVEKMVNWSFEIAPLRLLGIVVGNWGGYDVSGLMGAQDPGFVFMMNGYQRAAALVPMTRYDDGFSRAIGKWMLNLANASRLFYPKYLPAENQDSEYWSFKYDPESYIGYEGLRDSVDGKSPFATGDAIPVGWGYTNLSLYSSSNVGYLGAIVEKTEHPGILRLDLLATDFFRRPAYPTYLYYNPYDDSRSVEVELGNGDYDLYDAVSNSFLARNVSGTTTVSIPADAAIQLVHAPANGEATFEGNHLLIDGTVVDFRSDRVRIDRPPRIKSLAAGERFSAGEPVPLYCAAGDRFGDVLSYDWEVSSGRIAGEGPVVDWIPADAGAASFTCRVTDHAGNVTSASQEVTVLGAASATMNR